MGSSSSTDATRTAEGDDWIMESAEVFYSRSPLVALGDDGIERLKRQALTNPRLRSRLCAHAGKNDPLHEMVIVHHRDVYVRPHRHHARSESVHVMEGEADLVLFDEDGEVTTVVPLGAHGGGRAAFCRIPAEIFHTLVFHSEWFVFHETISGPFDPTRSSFAPWAPPDGPEGERFRSGLDKRLAAR